MGKTELALAVAQQLIDSFPDGQLHLDLGGSKETPLTADKLLLQVIHAFDLQAQVPDDSNLLDGRYRSLLAGRRILIIADDAAGYDQVIRLDPPPGCALLVTSRSRFYLSGMHEHLLGVLPTDDAEQLLLDICPRIAADAPQLAALCGHMPLALRVSASLLAVDSARDVARHLADLSDIRTRIAHMYDPDSSELDVEASLDLSYTALSPFAQTALRQLTVFPAPFDLPAAEKVINLKDIKLPPGNTTGRSRGRVVPPSVEDVMNELCRRSLFELDETTKPNHHGNIPDQDEKTKPHHTNNVTKQDKTIKRYRCHDVVRAFAIARLTKAEASRQWRYAVYYAGVATMAEALYQKGGDSILKGLELFDRERIHIDAGWRWAIERGDDQLLLTYAGVIQNIGFLRYDARLEIIPLATAALETARRLHRRTDEATAFNTLGSAYSALDEPQQALNYYSQSLDVCRATRNRQGQGVALGNLGSVYRDLGDLQRAIGFYQQALEIARAMGDRRSESVALGNIGWAYSDLGDQERAIKLCQQALEIMQTIGDRSGQGHALNLLGKAYAAKHQLALAHTHHQHALALAREVSKHYLEARAQSDLGDVLWQQGDDTAAIDQLQAALALAQRIEAHELATLTCWRLGLIAVQQGDLQRAVELLNQRITYEREIKHTRVDEHAALVAHVQSGGDPTTFRWPPDPPSPSPA